jgi:hypothetical protein
VVELELTLMAHHPDPSGDRRPLLERFEAEHYARVWTDVPAVPRADLDLDTVIHMHLDPPVSQLNRTLANQ